MCLSRWPIPLYCATRDSTSSLHVLGCGASCPTLLLRSSGFSCGDASIRTLPFAAARRFALSLSRRCVDSRWPFRGDVSIRARLFVAARQFLFSFDSFPAGASISVLHFTAVSLVCASPLVAALCPLAVACGALPYPAVAFFACAHHMPRAPTPRVLQW